MRDQAHRRIRMTPGRWLLAVTIAAILTAATVVMVGYAHRMALIGRIEYLHGLVETETVSPDWLLSLLGKERVRGFEPIVGVDLGSVANAVRQVDPELPRHLPPIGDKQLRVLRGLSSLRKLNLNEGNITDAGLAHLRDLRQLEELGLCGTQVSRQGILRLVEHMPHLKTLWLDAALLTDAFRERLAIRAPGLRVERCHGGLPWEGPDILAPLGGR